MARSTIPEVAIDPAAPTTLYLDVSINGWSARLVARFRLTGERLSLPADQFVGLGLRLDEAWVTHEGEARRVYLDRVPGLTWRVDLQAQTIDLAAPFENLTPRLLAVTPAPLRVRARSDRGMLVSYDLYGEWATDSDAGSYGRSVSSVLEARLFSSRYALVSTGGVSATEGTAKAVRYESYLAFDNPDRARTLRVGDSVTRGLVWSRNLRFGGVQYQRNFSLRPDILTTPLPEYRGGVTTPSVLDLYINGVQRYSTGVQPGAFLVNQLPVLTGANDVTIVLTDIDGRQRSVTLPLYVTTRLLAKGISDFSFEAGAVRRDYGTKSGDYARGFASATWRRGLSDALTLEAHGEATQGLWQAGVSGAVAVRDLLSLTGSLAASNGPGAGGWLWAIGADRTTQRFSLAARHEAVLDDFQDVADLMGEPHPRTRDVATVGLNLGRPGVLNLAYVSEIRADRSKNSVGTATYGVDLFGRRAHLSLTGYGALKDKDQWGVDVSISVPLGGGGLFSAGAERRSDSHAYKADIRGAAMDNRLLWQAQAVEGDVTARSAEVRWDGSTLDARGRLLNDGVSSAAQFELAQSLVLFGGDLYLTDRVEESFAVVQVGDVPGVEVFRENRSVGRTDARGRLFVNHLRAYEGNGLSIDPAALPLDAALDSTTKIAAPRRGGGVKVEFEVLQERSALVTLKTQAGATPPAGAEVHLGDRVFPLGYGGEVYLRGLAVGRNLIRVVWRERTCEVVVTVPAELGRIPRLGPYTCTS